MLAPGGTEDIERAASAVSVGDGWDLVSERVTPPQVLCLGGSPCPSLARTWEVPEVLSRTEFESLARETSSSLVVEGDCLADPAREGWQSLCSATGTVGGYRMSITQATSLRSGPEIILGVEPVR